MRVVLNTSPIIFLSKIDSLIYLADCIDEVYVSSGVVDELNGYELPAFIKVQSIIRAANHYFIFPVIVHVINNKRRIARKREA